LDIPAEFFWEWKHEDDDLKQTFRDIEVEIAISSIMRRYQEYLHKTRQRPPMSFLLFLTQALKEATNIAVIERLSQENYEGLEFIEEHETIRKVKLTRPISNENPVHVDFNDTTSLNYNLLSYQIYTWNNILDERSRGKGGEEAAAFIAKYQ